MRTAYSLMFFGNVGVSLSWLFVPLLARDLGLSFVELGTVGTAYGIASLFSYSFFGRLSDLTRRRLIFIQAGFALAALTFTLQVFMHDLFSMVLVRWFAGLSIGVFTFPLLAYISGRSGYRRRVGWFAGFGTLGWFTGYLLGGLLSDWFLAFAVSGLFFFTGFLLSLGFRELREPLVRIRPFWTVVRENSAVYASYLLRHTGAQAMWIVFPLFLREELGASIFWVGLIMALNTGSQFLFMGLIGRTARGGEGGQLLRLGLLLSAVVFASYHFSFSYLQLIPVQLLLGIAWSALYVGSLLHLLEKNVERATSTGVLGSTISLAAVIGPLLGGSISEFFGMRAVFLFACALTLAGLAVSKSIRS